ncbi:hypothetical protein SARC_02483 [Sphaeroforma arctica JP610]|uniref:Uncharacterized protein n=1 Tax=Sphaeroforma arctica JP610 TaxID=667725 RepID=A0A0L0G8X9_9EUKA|nr:hypothetical protein SARC_02483 [Sphaeroforma arctica JP610]KNC85336.1 hypothetical protein SARC_02483 [Sphaeroforma arctica JP610]|eukprot:XP_014159238.1 hypothetical protein SARC_02483 [Sphaeroforma arctica JP610]
MSEGYELDRRRPDTTDHRAPHQGVSEDRTSHLSSQNSDSGPYAGDSTAGAGQASRLGAVDNWNSFHQRDHAAGGQSYVYNAAPPSDNYQVQRLADTLPASEVVRLLATGGDRPTTHTKMDTIGDTEVSIATPASTPTRSTGIGVPEPTLQPTHTQVHGTTTSATVGVCPYNASENDSVQLNGIALSQLPVAADHSHITDHATSFADVVTPSRDVNTEQPPTYSETKSSAGLVFEDEERILTPAGNAMDNTLDNAGNSRHVLEGEESTLPPAGSVLDQALVRAGGACRVTEGEEYISTLGVNVVDPEFVHMARAKDSVEQEVVVCGNNETPEAVLPSSSLVHDVDFDAEHIARVGEQGSEDVCAGDLLVVGNGEATASTELHSEDIATSRISSSDSTPPREVTDECSAKPIEGLYDSPNELVGIPCIYDTGSVDAYETVMSEPGLPEKEMLSVKHASRLVQSTDSTHSEHRVIADNDLDADMSKEIPNWLKDPEVGVSTDVPIMRPVYTCPSDINLDASQSQDGATEADGNALATVARKHMHELRVLRSLMSDPNEEKGTGFVPSTDSSHQARPYAGAKRMELDRLRAAQTKREQNALSVTIQVMLLEYEIELMRTYTLMATHPSPSGISDQGIDVVRGIQSTVEDTQSGAVEVEGGAQSLYSCVSAAPGRMLVNGLVEHEHVLTDTHARDESGVLNIVQAQALPLPALPLEASDVADVADGIGVAYATRYARANCAAQLEGIGSTDESPGHAGGCTDGLTDAALVLDNNHPDQMVTPPDSSPVVGKLNSADGIDGYMMNGSLPDCRQAHDSVTCSSPNGYPKEDSGSAVLPEDGSSVCSKALDDTPVLGPRVLIGVGHITDVIDAGDTEIRERDGSSFPYTSNHDSTGTDVLVKSSDNTTAHSSPTTKDTDAEVLTEGSATKVVSKDEEHGVGSVGIDNLGKNNVGTPPDCAAPEGTVGVLPSHGITNPNTSVRQCVTDEMHCDNGSSSDSRGPLTEDTTERDTGYSTAGASITSRSVLLASGVGVEGHEVEPQPYMNPDPVMSDPATGRAERGSEAWASADKGMCVVSAENSISADDPDVWTPFAEATPGAESMEHATGESDGVRFGSAHEDVCGSAVGEVKQLDTLEAPRSSPVAPVPEFVADKTAPAPAESVLVSRPTAGSDVCSVTAEESIVAEEPDSWTPFVDIGPRSDNTTRGTTEEYSEVNPIAPALGLVSDDSTSGDVSRIDSGDLEVRTGDREVPEVSEKVEYDHVPEADGVVGKPDEWLEEQEEGCLVEASMVVDKAVARDETAAVGDLTPSTTLELQSLGSSEELTRLALQPQHSSEEPEDSKSPTSITAAVAQNIANQVTPHNATVEALKPDDAAATVLGVGMEDDDSSKQRRMDEMCAAALLKVGARSSIPIFVPTNVSAGSAALHRPLKTPGQDQNTPHINVAHNEEQTLDKPQEDPCQVSKPPVAAVAKTLATRFRTTCVVYAPTTEAPDDGHCTDSLHWPATYHSLVHSPSGTKLLELEENFDNVIHRLRMRRKKEMVRQRAVHKSERDALYTNLGDLLNDAILQEQEASQKDEAQLLRIRWQSKLESVMDAQRRQLREWVGKGDYTSAVVSDMEGDLKTTSESDRRCCKSRTGSGPVLDVNETQQESFSIQLGAQRKTSHLLRLLCCDMHVLLSREGPELRLLTAMSLYSDTFNGVVLLVDVDAPYRDAEGQAFVKLCERRTELHFSSFRRQLAQVREHSGTMLPGDFYITRHSNLNNVSVVYHLMVNSEVMSKTMSARSPILTGLRKLMLNAYQHNVASLTVPLLFVSAYTPSQWGEGVNVDRWCHTRAELVLKAVKGYMKECAPYTTNNHSSTMQFLLPGACSKRFDAFASQLDGR